MATVLRLTESGGTPLDIAWAVQGRCTPLTVSCAACPDLAQLTLHSTVLTGGCLLCCRRLARARPSCTRVSRGACQPPCQHSPVASCAALQVTAPSCIIPTFCRKIKYRNPSTFSTTLLHGSLSTLTEFMVSKVPGSTVLACKNWPVL